jgi:large subunit ribosomal protein L15
MNLHSLKSTSGARKRPRRVGRGHSSGSGKTCGRGHKGQMARAGHKRKPAFEGGQMPLIRRIPKRGFTNRNRKTFLPVNVAELARFDEGSEVTVQTLQEAGLANGACDGIKILGTGEPGKKLTVKANAFSASARTKIEAAGGTCEVIP